MDRQLTILPERLPVLVKRTRYPVQFNQEELSGRMFAAVGSQTCLRFTTLYLDSLILVSPLVHISIRYMKKLVQIGKSPHGDTWIFP